MGVPPPGHGAKRNLSNSTKRNDCPTTVTQLWSKIIEETTKIMVHFKENYFGRKFAASNEITIHEKKKAISNFMGKKLGHSRINNALSINSNVICVMRIMLAILADTFFNALRNINTLLLENTCVTPTIRETKIFRNNSPFLRNVVGNLSA